MHLHARLWPAPTVVAPRRGWAGRWECGLACRAWTTRGGASAIFAARSLSSAKAPRMYSEQLHKLWGLSPRPSDTESNSRGPLARIQHKALLSQFVLLIRGLMQAAADRLLTAECGPGLPVEATDADGGPTARALCAPLRGDGWLSLAQRPAAGQSPLGWLWHKSKQVWPPLQLCGQFPPCVFLCSIPLFHDGACRNITMIKQLFTACPNTCASLSAYGAVKWRGRAPSAL